MKQYGTIGDTFYFHFGSNDTSVSGDDGASAAAHVRLAGAAAGAAPVLSPTPTLLTHASYPAGCYEVAVVATVGNGFAADGKYAVYCTLAVDSQNPTGFIGSFDLSPVRTLLTGDSYARLGAPAGASVAADIADVDADIGLLNDFDPATETVNLSAATETQIDNIELDTDELQSNQGNWLTATGFSTHSAADVWAVGSRSLTSFGTLVSDIWSAAGRTLTAFGFPVNINGTKSTLDDLNDFDPATDVVANVTLVATVTTNADMRGTDGASTHNAADVTGGTTVAQAETNIRGGTDALNTLSAQLDTVQADLDDPGQYKADVSGLATSEEIAALNDVSAADVKAQADRALADIYLDALLAVDTSVLPGAAGSVLHDMLEDDAGQWRFSTNALEQGSTSSGLTAQDVRDAMKLDATTGAPAAGSIDKHLDNIEADTNELQSNQGNWLTATGFSTHSAADVVAAIFAEVVEGTLTLQQLLRIFKAVLAGKSGGGGSSTVAFRDDADTKDRVSATVDANGNRTAVTLDGS